MAKKLISICIPVLNEVDNIEVFDSFTKAKQKILLVLKMEKTEIDARIRDIKTWTKKI